ncbi:MAG: DinB family protein, partial [Phycisphaerae bacterium]
MATKNSRPGAVEQVSHGQDPDSASALAEHYRRVRRATERLAAPLSAEDCAIQSMRDVSPTKWHLAHTSWFFETLILAQDRSEYRPFHPDFRYLFNSYYNTIGDQFDRPSRGVLSRPSLEEIHRYRAYVDRHMLDFIDSAGAERFRTTAPVITLGLSHEQQHQELILTDIKHVFWSNPLRPAYREIEVSPVREAVEPGFVHFPEDVYHIGHEGVGFAYDNEGPRHKEFVGAFEITRRPVTNGEYLEFMADCGYERPEFWLSDGWS